MTTMSTTCGGCGRQLSLPERYLGRDLKCPSCGHPFRVEPPRATPTPAAAEPEREVFAAAPPSGPPSAPFGEPARPEPVPALAPGDAAPVEASAVYWRVRRVDVLSLAAMSAAFNAALGLVFGLMLALVSVTAAARVLPFLHGPLIGVVAVLVLPPAYAAIGFVAGAVAALVYNLAAKLTGGVRVLLE